MKPYDRNECEKCGTCLSACPAVELSEKEAADELAKLTSGGPSRILDKCISCFACSQACPRGLDVHGLVMDRWAETRTGNTVPAVVRACLPHQKNPNAWDRVEKYYTPREKSFLSRANQNTKGDEVLYLGCNQLLDPYIADSPLLAGLPLAIAPAVCCGEPYYRMGFVDLFERAASRWLDHWEGQNPSRMVMFCPACQNMVENVYPARLGRRPRFETVSLLEWLDEKIAAREVVINMPMARPVLVQDSCHSRILGEGYRRLSRDLLEKAGLFIALDETGEGSPCCGFAAAAAGFNPLTMARLGRRAVKRLDRFGADFAAASCNGCTLMLNMASFTRPRKSPAAYHLLDILNAAAGEAPLPDHRARSAKIIMAALQTASDKLVRPGSNLIEIPD